MHICLASKCLHRIVPLLGTQRGSLAARVAGRCGLGMPLPRSRPPLGASGCQPGWGWRATSLCAAWPWEAARRHLLCRAWWGRKAGAAGPMRGLAPAWPACTCRWCPCPAAPTTLWLVPARMGGHARRWEPNGHGCMLCPAWVAGFPQRWGPAANSPRVLWCWEHCNVRHAAPRVAVK